MNKNRSTLKTTARENINKRHVEIKTCLIPGAAKEKTANAKTIKAILTMLMLS